MENVSSIWWQIKKICFRMVSSSHEGRFRLALGRPSADDETYEVEGTVVLAIAPDVATQCEDKVLDLRKQPDGSSQLAFG